MLSDSFLPFFEWCGRTWLGTTVRDTVWAFPVIETFHLLALAILLGSVLIVNLRVFGLGRRFATVAELARELKPWMYVSLAVLIISGIPMAMSEPMKCFESISFPIKIVLIVVGTGAQLTILRKWILPNHNEAASPKAKVAACASIAVWTAVALAGKGIPYI